MSKLLYFETHKKPLNEEWLLLVHGAGGSTRTWKKQIEELGEKYNLLIPDLPGHSQNKDRNLELPNYTFENIGEKLWELVDHLSIKNIHLVGISLGTILCVQMRLLHPKRVLSLVLPGAIMKLNRKLRVLANVSLSLAKVIGFRSFYNLSARVMLPRNNHKTSRDVFIRESKALSLEEFKKWTELYNVLHKTLNSFFKEISHTPHILIMGSQDHLFLAPAKSYASFHDNAQISIVENCGHVVSIEKAKRFNEICLEFLGGLNTKEDKAHAKMTV